MEQLFREFSTADAATWKARLEKDLKGVTFDQLSVLDRNGITIHPFYTKEDIPSYPEPVINHRDWNICAQISVTDAGRANRQSLQELNNGASGLCFVINEMVDPAILLQDIELPFIYASFKLNENTVSFAVPLQAYIRGKGWDPDTMDCFIYHDTTGSYLQSGTKNNDELKAHRTIPQQIGIDAALFLNAGANTTYELACALAQLNECLQAHKPDEVKKVHLSLATDTAFFEQIAKLRALRKLLALLFESYQIAPQVHLHIETASTYRSPFDSYSNLLRDTIAGMAAVIGGCNSLYIRPFNEALEQSSDFSLRMSRNQQLIFKEESYLNKVADAAAGSYYIETLTEEIAEQAWEQFKAIEEQGGLIAFFEKGLLSKDIEAQAQQLIEEYKSGKRVLVGVNKFINAKDEPKPSNRQAYAGKGLRPLLLSCEIV